MLAACQSWLHTKQATASAVPHGHFGGRATQDSHRTGLTNPPEDWPATNPHDAIAVTPRELQMCEARVWLINFKTHALCNNPIT